MRGEFSTQFAQYTRTHGTHSHNWNPKQIQVWYRIGRWGRLIPLCFVAVYSLLCAMIPLGNPLSDKAKNLIRPSGILALHVEMCEAITQKHNTNSTHTL